VERELQPADGSANGSAGGASVGSVQETAPPPAPVIPPPPPPPPVTAPWVPPPTSAPPKARRSHKGSVIAVAIVSVLVLGALGGGGWYANASLSSQYSPQRAVTDYFAAQAGGNAAAMMDNATFLKGDGAVDRLFNFGAVKAMLGLAQNRQITNVKVTRIARVDDVTSDVTVSMLWAGTLRAHTYTVRMDPARAHDVFYHSWRVDIPSVSIRVTLPRQPGYLRVDDIDAPFNAAYVQAIEGYHTVSMGATDFYDGASQVVAGFDGSASATFDIKLSSLAVDSAKAAVQRTFAMCASNARCFNTTYYVTQKPGYTSYVYWTSLPGYGEIDAYTSWRWSLYGDPTSAMVLEVANDRGKVDASGSCGETLLVDDNRQYHFKGTWTSKLTWGSSGFISDLTYDCIQSKF
jgi:hypothetical protein